MFSTRTSNLNVLNTPTCVIAVSILLELYSVIFFQLNFLCATHAFNFRLGWVGFTVRSGCKSPYIPGKQWYFCQWNCFLRASPRIHSKHWNWKGAQGWVIKYAKSMQLGYLRTAIVPGDWFHTALKNTYTYNNAVSIQWLYIGNFSVTY